MLVPGLRECTLEKDTVIVYLPHCQLQRRKILEKIGSRHWLTVEPDF
jgi:hypothetical protein